MPDAEDDGDADGAINLVEFQEGLYACQPDTDGDGLLDGYELGYSCLNAHDYWDAFADQDADGASSYAEYVAGTLPCVADTDTDGLADGYEILHSCLNPLVPDAGGDPDADGAINLVEYQEGIDACQPDSDADGLPDGFETAHACMNPADPGDATEDLDGDGLSNTTEYLGQTNPCRAVPFDFDRDDDVDVADRAAFEACASGSAMLSPPAGCLAATFAESDADHDGDVDQADFGGFQRCYTGPGRDGDPDCAG